ncbi:uncharacterized protein PGTG_01694 [Puccinia graminis f. sp. tritici CRL 75-36-700-3]|uniref:Uncharacterized protein n=1 Tax=Puccinia graminis f. sp. tritici (strain CRL 75-36-700-3 / race SCCL) TaxID=418459 RepID=E3JSS6_PUCGT|nr:uncharacterized protein PGTG_01694 [Puccinia graminis f. sp. tritici CRL 75-36-700-3]EFP75101.1 hypothetical protein PGTG_01694 [Puccinia graminis f. sp. tritici CRL 75-36-700-3]
MFLTHLLVITFAITGPAFAIPMEQELAGRAARPEANVGRFPANTNELVHPREAPNEPLSNEVHVYIEQPIRGTTENQARSSNHPEPQNPAHSQTNEADDMIGNVSRQAYQIHHTTATTTGVAQAQRQNRRQLCRFFFAATFPALICLMFMGRHPIPSDIVSETEWAFIGAFFVYLFAVLSSLGAATIR